VRDDIPDLMQAMDAFLFPSLFEGLPVVLVEAQAAGLPCFASDSITRESDLTGRVTFVGLRERPSVWAERLLASPLARADTSARIAEQGYDTKTMSQWLADFYADASMRRSSRIIGGNAHEADVNGIHAHV
jgi:glycosyltransferase involved in cell wall biosynthesis